MKINKTRKPISPQCSSISRMWHHLFGQLPVNDQFSDCQQTEKISCFLCWDTARGWVQLIICGRTTSIYSNCVLCVPVQLPVEKYIIYCPRKTQAHPPQDRWCLDYYLCFFFVVSAALIVYQESVTQSTVWGSVPVQKMSEEVSTNCAVKAIIYGVHIERHQGHRQERVVCFAMLWAAFQRISKGSAGNAL